MINNKQFVRRVLEMAEHLSGVKYRVKDGELMVDAVKFAIEKALAEGEDISLHGFGAFKVHEYPERQATINEQTYNIPPRKGVKFSPGKRLRDEVANGRFQTIDL